MDRELRKLRHRRDWLLSDVANRTGYTVSHIASVERGTARAGRKLVAELAEAYGMAVWRMAKICGKTYNPQEG